MKPKFAQGYLDRFGKLHSTYEEAEISNKRFELEKWWAEYKEITPYRSIVSVYDLMTIRDKVNEIMGTSKQT